MTWGLHARVDLVWAEAPARGGLGCCCARLSAASSHVHSYDAAPPPRPRTHSILTHRPSLSFSFREGFGATVDWSHAAELAAVAMTMVRRQTSWRLPSDTN